MDTSGDAQQLVDNDTLDVPTPLITPVSVAVSAVSIDSGPSSTTPGIPSTSAEPTVASITVPALPAASSSALSPPPTAESVADATVAAAAAAATVAAAAAAKDDVTLAVSVSSGSLPDAASNTDAAGPTPVVVASDPQPVAPTASNAVTTTNVLIPADNSTGTPSGEPGSTTLAANSVETPTNGAIIVNSLAAVPAGREIDEDANVNGDSGEKVGLTKAVTPMDILVPTEPLASTEEALASAEEALAPSEIPGINGDEPESLTERGEGDEDRNNTEDNRTAEDTQSPPMGEPSSNSMQVSDPSGSGSKNERRTRTRLTVAQKVDVLRRLEKGERQSALAAEYGCSKRALARLKQERAMFHNIHLTEADSKRKSRHSVKHVILESKLSQFLRLARRNGFPINGNAVRRAALKLRDDLLADPNLPAAERPGLVAFQASINWSKGFLKRCGIRTVDAKQDAMSSQQLLDSKRSLEKRLAEYDLDCIFCIEKTLLFYKLLPNEPILQLNAHRMDEHAPDDRIEDRVTLILAANVTGSVQVPPTIVGSEAVPQCFSQQPCPLPYLSHAHSWVDDATFKTWFYCVLLPAVRRCTPKKVAVIVDSEWVPIDVSDNHCQVQLISIPKELPAERHPMNAGILSVFRRSLRYSLLERLVNVTAIDGTKTAASAQTVAEAAPAVGTQAVVTDDVTTKTSDVRRGAVVDRDVSLLELAQLVQTAWNGLTESLLAQCWCKAEILPEQNGQKLSKTSGSVTITSDEQMFFACCTPAQIRAIRTLEDLIINRQLYAANSASRRARDLVTSLHETGRRGIEAWLDVESSPKAQRALSAELDCIISVYKSPIATQKSPAKRNAGQAFGTDAPSVAQGEEKLAEPLPHLTFLMDLLAPLQKIVDECDSGSAPLLLRNLKHELVRVKSEQDRRCSGNAFLSS